MKLKEEERRGGVKVNPCEKNSCVARLVSLANTHTHTESVIMLIKQRADW